MTLYALKPRFQQLLRPLVALLPPLGVTANIVTVIAAVGSLLVGAIAIRFVHLRWVFLLVPLWLIVRMALNAIDGMLAREFHQKSVLGGYLNEIGDVVSDAAVYAPFGFVAPFTPIGIGIVILLSTLTEFAGVLGEAAGASRRYDGPMGKSDRAFVFGALGMWIGLSAPTPPWLWWAIPTLAVLLCLTTANRIRAVVVETTKGSPTR